MSRRRREKRIIEVEKILRKRGYLEQEFFLLLRKEKKTRRRGLGKIEKRKEELRR